MTKNDLYHRAKSLPANMLGSEFESAYWLAHEMADEIERLNAYIKKITTVADDLPALIEAVRRDPAWAAKQIDTLAAVADAALALAERAPVEPTENPTKPEEYPDAYFP